MIFITGDRGTVALNLTAPLNKASEPSRARVRLTRPASGTRRHAAVRLDLSQCS